MFFRTPSLAQFFMGIAFDMRNFPARYGHIWRT
jgi:hypothetical protein